MNLLPILIVHIKATATDWTVEGKGGSGAFREGEERKEKWHAWRQRRQRKGKERRWKEDGEEPHGLEKLQVVRDLIAGEQSSVVVNLHDQGMQLIYIVTELCVLCTGFLWLEIYSNKLVNNILIRTLLT